jgi:hypothetical protein
LPLLNIVVVVVVVVFQRRGRVWVVVVSVDGDAGDAAVADGVVKRLLSSSYDAAGETP